MNREEAQKMKAVADKAQELLDMVFHDPDYRISVSVSSREPWKFDHGVSRHLFGDPDEQNCYVQTL